MTKFSDFGLDQVILKSLDFMGYDAPTPIQAQTIPLALDGRDVLGSAQTGTGKTAAFAIPLINKLLNTESGTALVLTPTRELGKQVMEVMQQLLGPKSPIKTAFIIGGEPMRKQFEQLKRNPRLVVGTPGRINDHLKRGSLKLNDTRFLVLDETDRMLDMGFSIQLDDIAEYMDGERQTLMFSATMPKNIMRMADKYLSNPERISIGANNTAATKIQQDVLHVKKDKKYKTLLHELKTREGTILIFVNTKRESEHLAKQLKADDFTVDAIHGDLRQFRREKIIKKLRAEQFRILVATDVIARGLDVPHIAHVINYDLPMMPEDYIHRIGRTARGGAEGCALNLVSPQDGRRWNAIQRLLDPNSDGDYGEHPSRSRGPSKNRGKGGFKKGRPDRKDGKGGKFSKGKFDKKGKSFKGGNKSRDFDRDDAQNDNQFDRPYEKKSSGKKQGGYKDNYKDNSERSFKKGKSDFKRRDERSFDKKKSDFKDREDRPYKKKSSEFKSRDDRPFKKKTSDHAYSGRPQRNEERQDRSERGDRPFEKKHKGESNSQNSWGDRPAKRGGKPGQKRRDERSFDGNKGKKKPFNKNKGNDKPAFSGKKKKKMAASQPLKLKDAA